jgi:putative ubiquitin-RnfH superfamily antitoxin RatB of RatAB toxin-antitoxin module
MALASAPDKYTVKTMSEDKTITVEVAYAMPHKQALLELKVAVGVTALEAARQSGVSKQFEGVDLDNAKFGIFGKVVSPQQVLCEGDRVEVYRPLIADPKEVRKARAARAKERRSQE